MTNLQETLAARLEGKSINEQTILNAIKKSYGRVYNLYLTEEEAFQAIIDNYEGVSEDDITQLDSYDCYLDGSVSDEEYLIIDNIKVVYIPTYHITLTSYFHDAGAEETDYSFVISISNN